MIKLFFSGDVLLQQKTYLPNEISKAIVESDYSICNFEAPIPSLGAKKSIKAGPNLSQGVSAVKELKKMGFDIITLANNHIIDYGLESIKNTCKVIEDLGMTSTGFYFDSKEIKALRLTKNNIKVSLISCGENTEGCLKYNNNSFGYLWTQSIDLEKLIQKEKSNSDYVIVSVHAGLEKVNFPLNQWKNQYRKLLSLGADVIIGHHPHLAQGIEQNDDGLIFYSLGNFIFDYPKNSSEESPNLSVKLKFDKKHLDYEIFFHKKKGDKIILQSDKELNLKKINYALNETHDSIIEQEKIINQYISSFNKYIKLYSFGIANLSFYSISKWIYYQIFNKKAFKEKRKKLLEHLLIIDTNRYILEEYLKKKT